MLFAMNADVGMTNIAPKGTVYRIVNMLIDKLLKLHTKTEKEKVEMILSNKLDLMYKGEACISIKQWSSLADDLIKWKNYKKKNKH